MTHLTDIPFSGADGTTSSLSDYATQVVLVVNVASQCGLTPQFESLQRLYTEHMDDGFAVLGFPANDFMGQEPGSDQEIQEFCSTQYSVTFPVLAKISVVGEHQHPLYAELTAQQPQTDGKAEFRDRLRASGLTPREDPDVLWNFEKFLISREGRVVRRFAPGVAADDPAVVAAVRNELDVKVRVSQKDAR